jgi:hypothetical protein
MQIISNNPMSNMLDEIRASIPQNIDIFDYIASGLDIQSVFGRLIGQLALHPFARTLLPNSNDNFSTHLYLFLSLWSGQESLPERLLPRCSSLLEKVASKKSDVDVWNSVYELLEEFARTPPRTPPPPPPDSALKPRTLDTPARPNTGTSLSDSQIRDEVDPLRGSNKAAA